ncbi:unnamed protein product [Lactuca saligna]|uniref:Uncharacterized protein n=1 Tax=Lactuca saligna TaxID=75948 RepID=A0AA35VXV3_LACSI|nr:unnamed protein product [Lactuca saligna]
MQATGVGMMMTTAVVWEAQVLGGYRSASDQCCSYAALELELPIVDPAQPTASLVGPNALLEGYGKGMERDELQALAVGAGGGVVGGLRSTVTPKLDWRRQLVDGMSLAKVDIFLFRLSIRRYSFPSTIQ